MRPGMGVAIIVASAQLVAMTAEAGEVRKCRDDTGHPSYVSGACPPGTRELWLREVAPEPVPADDIPRRLRELRQWQERNQRSSARGYPSRRGFRSRPMPVDTQARACEKARRRRDEVRDRDWYTITIDRLRQLDDAVTRACR